MRLTAGGTITNFGTLISPSGPFGAQINGNGSLDNAGTVIGNAGVDITGAAAVVNTGHITGAYASSLAAAIEIGGGGSVANGSPSFTSAAISGANSGVVLSGGIGTLTNDGTIIGSGTAGYGVKFSTGGTVTDGSSAVTLAAISGGLTGVMIKGGSGTVANYGSIAGTVFAGIYLTGGAGTLTNGSSSDTVAAITGGQTGVILESGGVVTNDATISGATNQGIFGGGSDTITNGSSSVTSALIESGGYGVELISTSTVVNFGTIQGDGRFGIETSGLLVNHGTLSGANGLRMVATNGTVSNDGTIIGNSALAGYAAVRMSNGGTLTNAGSLIASSGTAVQFAGAGNDLLIIDPGASFGGGLVLGNTAVTTTLEMASGTSIGTLTGLGSRYVAFTTVSVDIGANWLLASDTIGAGYTITDNGTLTNTGSLGDTVTLGANAVLTDSKNGTISAGRGVAGYGTGITVVNAGSIAGYTSSGVGVFLGDGGSITNLSTGTITALYGIWSQGAGTIVNAGSLYGLNDAVKFVSGYTNRLVVDPGATFTGTVTGGNAIGAAPNSTLELAAGTGTGTLSGIGSIFVDFVVTTIDAGAVWSLSGANTIASGATLTELAGASLTVTGALVNNGAIVLDPSTLRAASLVGSGSVTIAAGSTFVAQGTVASGETLTFGGSGGYLHLDSPLGVAGTITNFALGETIDLKGISPASVSYSGGTLHFAGGSVALGLSQPGTVTATASTDGTQIALLCCCSNTLILTPDGECAVQDLAVGELVTTVRGDARRIAWIGTGKVLATRGRRSGATPVIVRKGALADNVPNRDLRLTKGHALWLDNVLIPVELLLNHRSIEWDDRAQQVTLYHIELDTHDVLLANGAPAGSYRDDGNRWLFSNANSGWQQEPQAPCASLLSGGSQVDAIWRRLLQRSSPRPGVPLTDDADLHLLVDGQRLNGMDRGDGVHAFRFNGPSSCIRILSRTAVPQELGLVRDPRQLGVAVRRIMLWQSTRLRTIEAHDAALSEGFHPHEAEGFRWTNGDAVIPDAMVAGLQGPCTIEVHVACLTRYPLTGPNAERLVA